MIDRSLQFKCRDDIYYAEQDGALLLFGGTPELNRISGDDTALSKELVDVLRVPHSREEIGRALGEPVTVSAERLDEMLEAFVRVGVLQLHANRKDFTSDELEEHRLTLNYLSGVLRGEPGYRLLRAILEIRILLIGSELLGSRVFASLLTSGYGHTTIAARTGAISLSEARNSPVFPRSAVGCSKAEFLAAYAADAQRPQVKVITAERETIEARLAETDLVICAPDIQSVDFLRWLNRACIARQVPWILAGYFQDEGHVGPTFVPGVTACYHCFLQRTLGSVPYHPEYLAMQAALAEQQEVLSGLPAFYDLIAGYLAGEVIRLVQFVPKEFNDLLERRKRARTYPEYAAALGTRYSLPETWGSYVTIGMHPFELTKRRILRLPRCEECGVHSHKEPQLVQWVLPV